MGSCTSIHKTSGSSSSVVKFGMSSSIVSDHPTTTAIPHNHNHNPSDSIPSSPIKHTNINININMDNNPNPNPNATPTTIDPRILSLRNRSRFSSASIHSYRSFGSSKEETFFDSQPWLESDCDDDFYSVGGDFSSRESTPAHSAVGSPRLNRVFSPQVNRALLEGRPPPRNGSNLSRGSTPTHQRNSSSPQITATFSEATDTTTSGTSKMRKKLADLFRESIRERAGEFLALEDYAKPKKETTSPNSPASVLPPKSGNRTPYVSGSLSNGKITPADDYFPDREKQIKSPQCCFPRLVSIRSYRENRKASNPPTPSNDHLMPST